MLKPLTLFKPCQHIRCAGLWQYKHGEKEPKSTTEVHKTELEQTASLWQDEAKVQLLTF